MGCSRINQPFWISPFVETAISHHGPRESFKVKGSRAFPKLATDAPKTREISSQKLFETTLMRMLPMSFQGESREIGTIPKVAGQLVLDALAKMPQQCANHRRCLFLVLLSMGKCYSMHGCHPFDYSGDCNGPANLATVHVSHAHWFPHRFKSRFMLLAELVSTRWHFSTMIQCTLCHPRESTPSVVFKCWWVYNSCFLITCLSDSALYTKQSYSVKKWKASKAPITAVFTYGVCLLGRHCKNNQYDAFRAPRSLRKACLRWQQALVLVCWSYQIVLQKPCSRERARTEHLIITHHPHHDQPRQKQQQPRRNQQQQRQQRQQQRQQQQQQ